MDGILGYTITCNKIPYVHNEINSNKNDMDYTNNDINLMTFYHFFFISFEFFHIKEMVAFGCYKPPIMKKKVK